eukprot:1156477-Pelagomonas_calceolata.AAC.9
MASKKGPAWPTNANKSIHARTMRRPLVDSSLWALYRALGGLKHVLEGAADLACCCSHFSRILETILEYPSLEALGPLAALAAFHPLSAATASNSPWSSAYARAASKPNHHDLQTPWKGNVWISIYT